jgi:WD40 repeat protein
MEAKLLETYQRLLYSNTPLIGGWLLRKTVERLMNDGTPEAVRVLEEAATHNGDAQIQFKIVTALRRLAEQGDAEAQEELCRLTIFHDLPLARETALALSCAPRDASQRALFYFLTEQWDEYERLDFDHSLLRGVYQAGDEKLRQRIGERARGAGRVEWVEVVVGRGQGRQLGEMTDREWEVTLEVLSGSGRWAEMWRLAQEAPAKWGARLLRWLSDAGWAPEGDAARADYEELARLAGRWTETGLDSLARRRGVLEGHKGPVTCLAISPDGRLLASGSDDMTVRLWNLADGAPLKTLECKTRITCLAISSDGRTLAAGAKMVRLWSLPDGAPLTLEESDPDASYCIPVDCIAISPDGRILAGGYRSYPLQFWSMPDGARLSSMEKRFGRHSTVYSMAFSPDGSVLAGWTGWNDEVLSLWNMRSGRWYSPMRGTHSPSDRSLAFSSDGRMLVGGADETVYLWSLPDGTPWWRQPDDTPNFTRPEYMAQKKLEGHESHITSLAISPDGRILASGSRDCTVRLWRLPDGAPLNILKGESSVHSLSFNPDGHTLASGSGCNVELWSVNSFCYAPISQASIGDMVWAQETLRNGNLNAEQRNCLEFIAALIRLRRRFDIQLSEPTRRIEAGEFDIEIEG